MSLNRDRSTSYGCQILANYADRVKEYLTWAGQRGGPLVTTNNITVRSDLRLYTSDDNKTMQRCVLVVCLK